MDIAPNPRFVSKPDDVTIVAGTKITLMWEAISENSKDYTVTFDETILCSGSWASGTIISCEINSAELELGENLVSITVNGHRNTSSTYTSTIEVISPKPSAPRFVDANFKSDFSSDAIVLTWESPSSTAILNDSNSLQYWIFRARDALAFSFITKTTLKEFQDKDWSPGHRYTYKIYAGNSAGSGEFAIAEISIPGFYAPTNVRINGYGNDYIVTWDNYLNYSLSQSAKFIIARSVDGGTFENFTVSGDLDFFVDRDFNPSFRYVYKVKVEYSGRQAEFSTELAIQGGGTNRNSLTLINLEVQKNDTSLIVLWDNILAETISYGSIWHTLIRSKDGGEFKTIYSETDRDVSSYIDLDVVPGSIYAYKVLVTFRFIRYEEPFGFSEVVEFEFLTSSARGFVFFLFIGIPLFAIVIGYLLKRKNSK